MNLQAHFVRPKQDRSEKKSHCHAKKKCSHDESFLFQFVYNMERPGIEPGTYGLKIRCSTN